MILLVEPRCDNLHGSVVAGTRPATLKVNGLAFGPAFFVGNNQTGHCLTAQNLSLYLAILRQTFADAGQV